VPAADSTTPDADLRAALGGNIDSTSAVSEVTRRLLDYFTNSSVQPGTRLPPERQLAASMGVGRSAIREALAALEVLGVVSVRPGSGTYLRGSVSELLPQTLSWGMLLGEPRTRDLIGVRHGLEVQAARLAATNSTRETLAMLSVQLDTMKASVEDYPSFTTADMQFHQQVAAAAQNSLLEDILQSVRSLLRVWVERGLRDADHARLTCAEHEAVLIALQSGSPERAAEAMSEHMDSAGRRLMTSLD
jgi:GntR family transcriptional repressor for pyruvate dehydrogenase complex